PKFPRSMATRSSGRKRPDWRKARCMEFAIKDEIPEPGALCFTFTARKTMYGGSRIAEGDTVFIFASENEDGGRADRARLRQRSIADPENSGHRPPDAQSEHHGT